MVCLVKSAVQMVEYVSDTRRHGANLSEMYRAYVDMVATYGRTPTIGAECERFWRVINRDFPSAVRDAYYVYHVNKEASLRPDYELFRKNWSRDAAKRGVLEASKTSVHFLEQACYTGHHCALQAKAKAARLSFRYHHSRNAELKARTAVSKQRWRRAFRHAADVAYSTRHMPEHKGAESDVLRTLVQRHRIGKRTAAVRHRYYALEPELLADREDLANLEALAAPDPVEPRGRSWLGQEWHTDVYGNVTVRGRQ